MLRGGWRRLEAVARRGECGVANAITMLGGLAGATTLAALITVAQGNSLTALGGILDSGAQRLERTLEVRGTIVARTDGDPALAASVTLPLALVAGSGGVVLSGPDSGLTVSYRDSNEYVADVPYTVGWLAADRDDLLEYGEIALLTVTFVSETGTPLLHAPAGEQWTLELIDATGGTLSVTRRLPPILQPVMGLR